MAASMIAPIFGSFTQSAFAQNVGLVAVTGVKSRFVVAYAGIILVILGLMPIMGRVIATVPTAVLGGAGMYCLVRLQPVVFARLRRSAIPII